MNIFLEKIIEAIVSLVVNFFPTLFSNLPTEASARAELVKLCERANRIRARLDDADQNRKVENEQVLLWLGELRSIAFDIEDLNEEFHAWTQVARGVSHWVTLKSAWYYWGVKSRVDDINKRYNAIYSDRQKLSEFNESPRSRSRDSIPRTSRLDSPQTGSLDGNLRLCGRNKENEQLHRLLLRDSNNTRYPPVISITGGGGIGKTALAQYVFNHEAIREHFEPLIWVSLSANPDPVETIKKIIEAINETSCNLSTLDMLQRTLQQLLCGKMFLLVLDGVYTDTKDMLFWDPVWIPLSMAHRGSRVLATTRNKTTAQYMGSSYQVALTGLNSSLLWLVLKEEAFPQTPTFDPVPGNLEGIGKKIAEKCYGSPLVAKLLGRALCGTNDVEDWINLLDEMPNPDKVIDNILPSLKRSYELLPVHLKRCFAYCSIFPKGYEFDRDDLVKLWMSEGLLKCERRNARTLEDIGRKQFNDLLWRSFFQPCGRPGGCDRYAMPGAIHDLAEFVSKYECARVDYSDLQHGKLMNTRYLFLCMDHLKHEWLNHIYSKEHLRTLIIYTVDPVPVQKILQQKLLSNLKCLRSLDLSKCKVDNLHESIGNLIHLRYLNLCGSLFKTLPDSICKLLNLQTLNLDECYNLKKLPQGMSSLINLRHIGLSLNWKKWDGKDFDSMPPEMGRLTSLQTLSRFVVAKRYGCGITELKDLNLRGDLCISKLENVKNSNDASDAELWMKGHLRNLMLRWSDRKYCDSGNDEEVIRQLYPSNSIKSICIEGYGGSGFPLWVTEPSFSHLETLKLVNCKICDELPHVAALPQLKSLYLLGLDKVTDLDGLVGQTIISVGFPSLELLHLSNMLELEKWFSVPNGSLTKLCELSISNCPKLEQISHLPPSLMRLELRNCRAQMQLPTTVPSLSNLIMEGVGSNLVEWVQNLTSLASLSLINVSDVERITEGNLRHLSGLKMLKIDACNTLISIEINGGPQYLPSLKKLEIISCAKFRFDSDQVLPHQIEELYLKDLKSFDQLPSGLNQLGHLRTLEICDVPKLQSVPKISSLDLLFIKGCPELERGCKNGGQNWNDVKHVRCRYIGGTQQPR